MTNHYQIINEPADVVEIL